MNHPVYDDDYSSCSETFSTLCIYHDDLPPTDVTARLGVEPDKQSSKGVVPPGLKRPAKVNSWRFGTQDKLDSLDSRRHIDWIIDRFIDKKEAIQSMLNEGYEISIFSFWVSESANGGPTLSPYQMKRLSDLNIEVSWDIYFNSDEPDS